MVASKLETKSDSNSQVRATESICSTSLIKNLKFTYPTEVKMTIIHPQIEKSNLANYIPNKHIVL